jgi:hypothetical protein
MEANAGPSIGGVSTKAVPAMVFDGLVDESKKKVQ